MLPDRLARQTTTAAGDEVTAPITAVPAPGSPPARPRFEFREPPSAERVPRPPVVLVSWICWLAGVGALLTTVAGSLLAVDDLRADLLAILVRDYPGETAATRDRVVQVAVIVLLAGGALLAAVQAGFATAMRAGRSWARVALVLLLGPVLLHSVLLGGVAAPIIKVLLGAEVGLALVAAALMFLPGSGRWFAARAGRR